MFEFALKKFYDRSSVRLLICDCKKRTVGRADKRCHLRRLVKVSDDGPLVDRPLMTLKGLARRYRVEFCTPPNRNANHLSVYSDLPRTKGINLALCVGCAQFFGPQLLDAFDACVNLRDGALPAYRGRLATHRKKAGAPFALVYITGSLISCLLTAACDLGIWDCVGLTVRPSCGVVDLELMPPPDH